MKGDYSRFTFDQLNHYRRVFKQQGRVELDADWNEQVAILLHYLQALAADFIGPHGGPENNYGFGIALDETMLDEEEQEHLEQSGLELENTDFFITTGHYYADGILCENDEVSTYFHQPDYPVPYSEKLEDDKTYLVYLDVWERHITYIEDETIREVALGEMDTATRAKVVWQVKATSKRYDDEGKATAIPDGYSKGDFEKEEGTDWKNWLEKWQPKHRGMLKAKAREVQVADMADPCTTDPEARYRSKENQLYRVEVHKGGLGFHEGETENPTGDITQAATFKWSRDNGSVVFPIRKLTVTTAPETTTTTVLVEHLGRDDRMKLKKGNWVEIVDDDYVRQHRAEPLLKVIDVNENTQEVTLEGVTGPQVGLDSSKHPLLRRWDHDGSNSDESKPPMANDGALLIQEGKWLTLENGVQVYFDHGSSVEGNSSHTYRTDDYWLIPGRTAIGDLEWPGPEGEPEAKPPHGVTHHYAPLVIFDTGGDGSVIDLRNPFKPIWEYETKSA